MTFRDSGLGKTGVRLVLLFVLCRIIAVPAETAFARGKMPLPETLSIRGEKSRHGIFDPSIEYDSRGVGWMSYSSISMPRVNTHLARSTDHGATWEYMARLNDSSEAVLVFEGKEVKGVWRNEVSSLVYDPDDPGREWKIFWHRYFVKKPYKPRDRVFSLGWIAYRYASDPRGKWSDEAALFGAGKFPLEPYRARISLDRIHPELEGYHVFTEPGTLYRNGVLYMSLEASRSLRGVGEWQSRKIVLLASEDHGRSWQYRGKLVDYADAKHLGYTALTGGSLFAAGGGVFFMATPSGALSGSYKNEDGIVIFEFEDIASARLKRNAQGRLIPFRRLILEGADQGHSHGGQGDYDPANTAGGVVMGQVVKPGILGILGLPGAVKPFNIICTGETVGAVD